MPSPDPSEAPFTALPGQVVGPAPCGAPSVARRWGAMLGIAAAALGPASAMGAGEHDAASGLPLAQLSAGIHRIRAEVAATEAARERGLMWRSSLGANAGMLFVFEQPGVYCFWMKNTLIPLSIAFLDASGVIVTVAEMGAGSETSWCPAGPVKFALEMNKGWFGARGLSAGSRVAGLPQS